MPRSRFTTVTKKYAIQSEPLAYSSQFGPKQLNATVKKLLKDNDVDAMAVNFNFFIKGQRVSEPLIDFIANNNMSEEIEEISYDVEVNPPNLEGEVKTQDPITSLKFRSKWIVAASYDIQIFDVTSLDKPVIFIEMKEEILTVDWLSLDEPNDEGVIIAGSIKGNISLWRCNMKTLAVSEICKFEGPKESVSCFAVCKEQSLVASGTTSGSLTLWSTDLSGLEVVNGSSKTVTKRSPLTSITSAHERPIRGMRWMMPSAANNADPSIGNLLTSGEDNKLRVWSVSGSLCSVTTQEDTTWPVRSIDVNADTGLVAVGSQNNRLKLYDLNKQPSQLHNIFNAHQCAIVAVKWSPTNQNHFLTAGNEGALKLWDVRNMLSPILLLSKVASWIIACDWSEDGQWIASSYGDLTLRVHKFE